MLVNCVHTVFDWEGLSDLSSLLTSGLSWDADGTSITSGGGWFSGKLSMLTATVRVPGSSATRVVEPSTGPGASTTVTLVSENSSLPPALLVANSGSNIDRPSAGSRPLSPSRTISVAESAFPTIMRTAPAACPWKCWIQLLNRSFISWMASSACALLREATSWSSR